jgi:hypothetical protein
MKKSIIYSVIVMTIALVFGFTMAHAQTINWVKETTKTVYWDAVAKVATTDDANQYQMYSRLSTTTVATKVGTPITATLYTMTFPVDWKGFVGVSAIRMVAGAQVAESDIAWSDNPIVTNNLPFGFDTWRGISWPTRVRTTQ